MTNKTIGQKCANELKKITQIAAKILEKSHVLIERHYNKKKQAKNIGFVK